MKIFIPLIFLIFSLSAPAKNDVKHPGPITKVKTTKNRELNKQVQDELMRNADIQYCYAKSDLGREKKAARFVVDLSVNPQGEVTERKLNSKLSSPDSPEISNCILEVLNSLIIPFKSKERGQVLSTTFTFPVKKKKH